MAVFKFTSPEGDEYYGEGASPEEAFRTAEERSPHELAAMRTRQSVVHGAPAADTETHDTGPVDLGDITGEVFTAVAPQLSMLGRAVMPVATAEEGKFPFIADAQERQAAELAYSNIKEYSPDPKTGRKVFDKALTAKARNEFFAEQQKLAKQRGEDLAAQQDWETAQAPAVEKLSPDERQIYESISVPGNPGQTRAQKGEFLRDVAEQRKRLSMTWAEKHPEEMEQLQMAAAGLSVVAPIYQAWRRARGFTKTAKEAETAFQKAIKSRAPKGAKEEMAWRANLAEEMDKIHDPDFLRAIGKSALIGGLVSGFATQAPNFIDWARQPEGSEARAKARGAVLDPENWLRSSWEGAVGAGAGKGLAEKFGVLPQARARNRAILGTIRERQAAEDAAKAEAARARAEKRTATPRRNPLAPQSPLSLNYGSTNPMEYNPLQQNE